MALIWSSSLLDAVLTDGRYPGNLGSSVMCCRNLSILCLMESREVSTPRFLISFGIELKMRDALYIKLLCIRVVAWQDLDDLTGGVMRTLPRLGEYLYEIPGFGTLLCSILNIYMSR